MAIGEMHACREPGGDAICRVWAGRDENEAISAAYRDRRTEMEPLGACTGQMAYRQGMGS
ncbi:hypothetical protein AZH53_07785 [Methanomicrobiaceae archaeon CYW5]|nr:hypothetical protein [Methanovulcanius yangii]